MHLLHIHYLTYLPFLFLWKHLSSTLFANFDYILECNQL